jgi:hypothetical protein
VNVRTLWGGFLSFVVIKAMMPGAFVRYRCKGCGKRHSDIEAMAGLACKPQENQVRRNDP